MSGMSVMGGMGGMMPQQQQQMPPPPMHGGGMAMGGGMGGGMAGNAHNSPRRALAVPLSISRERDSTSRVGSRVPPPPSRGGGGGGGGGGAMPYSDSSRLPPSRGDSRDNRDRCVWASHRSTSTSLSFFARSLCLTSYGNLLRRPCLSSPAFHPSHCGTHTLSVARSCARGVFSRRAGEDSGIRQGQRRRTQQRRWRQRPSPPHDAAAAVVARRAGTPAAVAAHSAWWRRRWQRREASRQPRARATA